MLIVVPWMGFWDRNFFVERFDVLAQLLSSPVARGAVSGIGIVTSLAGLAELTAALAARRPAAAAHEPPLRSDR
ncbi:MAG TPA: hypothetical protein VE379_11380 [Vicinamibacterales bacterium]|nr:hypothetical protein [Vicinamibacterales bacterium]